jgi:hypothetical protein
MRDELERINAEIEAWERRLAAGEPVALEPALEAATGAALALVRAYLAAEGSKPVPAGDADLLEAFKLLVKGDPTWNAIRDNLPAVPEKMAIRLARHVYLYLRTRCVKEGRVAA